MKSINILMTVFFFSCKGNHSDASRLNALIHDDSPRKIVISCIRCGCVDDELNRVFEKEPGKLGRYKIYGDTSCRGRINAAIEIHDIRQPLLDSMMPDFYNILLIKDAKGKMVQTEEMEKLVDYL
jgi:hypothetical protein